MESILVLEDDENLRTLIADTLGDEGYQVTEASCAEEAISRARSRSFHLILSDVRMAGVLDGVGAVEQIKAFQPRIRSIVLTGYTDQNVPLRAAQVQADDYLVKPVHLAQLLAVVRLTLDRESSELDLLGQVLHAPGDLAQRALSWIFEGRLQELAQLRERCYQSLFVLLRSKRLSAEDAYPVYLRLLDVESKYNQAKPADWGKLISAYSAIDRSTNTAITRDVSTHGSDSALTWPTFRRFCQILQEGHMSAEQFNQSALLFLEPAKRRANLASYLAYQKLWGTGGGEASSAQVTDPLLGRTFGGYTLHRLVPEYTEARVYSAVSDAKESRLVIAFHLQANAQNIIQEAVQSGKAIPLGQHEGFELLLCNQQTHPLRQQLPPDGLSPSSAWKILRPVFLQVQKYHEQGICSGNITLDDIEVVPGQLARLTRFSPDYSLRVIQDGLQLKASGLSQPCRILSGIPLEIASASVNQPIPASDQAMLAYNFSKILLGPGFSFSTLVFFCLPQNHEVDRHPTWRQIHEVCSRTVPQLYAVLSRMAHFDPAQRYPSVCEAISVIDQVLKPRPLSSMIPAEGLPPKEAWRLLRPLFLQVQAYHDRGIASGSFDIRSVEVSPEGDAQISHFSPDKSLLHLERSKHFKRQSLDDVFGLASEIVFATVDHPLFASDQPPLGRIFAQVLGGPSRKDWYQPLLLHTDEESTWLHLHTRFFEELSPCICRLTRPNPADRFPQIRDAIDAFDQLLFNSQSEA